MKQASLPYQFALPQLFEKFFKPQSSGHIAEEEEQPQTENRKRTKTRTVTAEGLSLKPSFRVGWTPSKSQDQTAPGVVPKINTKKAARTLTPERVVGLHAVDHIDQKKTELRWHCAQDAELYEIQYNDTSYDDLRWSKLCETPSVQVIPSETIASGEYYFRVRAKSKFGVGPWSGQCLLRVG
ncbi:hypothetical protein [Halocola ammonii]